MRGRFLPLIRALFGAARAQAPSARESALIDQLAEALTKTNAART